MSMLFAWFIFSLSQVAEIISEIQQYQNQPYCLSPYPKLKQFIETLDPFPSWSEKEVTEISSFKIHPKTPPSSPSHYPLKGKPEATKRDEVSKKFKKSLTLSPF